MKTKLDSVDVLVAIGMFATILGGVALVIASYVGRIPDDGGGVRGLF